VGVTFVPLTRHYYREMQQISFRNDILPLKDKLFRLAFRITLDRAEAEDIVQETLIRIWNKKDEWKHLDSIEAFSLTICRNLSIDRSQKKEAQNVEFNENLHDIADSSNTLGSMEYNEKMQIIRRLFNKLPEKQRSVMQLRDIEEKSYKEIAEILNITEEQVKINLFRARKNIRQQYIEIENYGL
jgi:RNA polymerase sigma-70 factor, ECF subfamily